MYQGYFKLQYDSGLNATYKSTIEGLGSGTECCELMRVIESVDSKYFIVQGQMDSEPTESSMNGTLGITLDSFELFDNTPACRQYIIDNSTSWGY